jgi:hypothetical protein
VRDFSGETSKHIHINICEIYYITAYLLVYTYNNLYIYLVEQTSDILPHVSFQLSEELKNIFFLFINLTVI